MAGAGHGCFNLPFSPPLTNVGVGIGTPQGPSQRPVTGSERGGHNSGSKDGTAEKPRAHRRTRARSWDRSSRSGSISEGHQSPEHEVESKKKVDWCDPQWNGPVDAVGTVESGHGSQVSKEAGTPPCLSPFVCLASPTSASLNLLSLSTTEAPSETAKAGPLRMAILLQ